MEMMISKIMVMVREEEWSQIRETQLQIMEALKTMTNAVRKHPGLKI